MRFQVPILCSMALRGYYVANEKLKGIADRPAKSSARPESRSAGPKSRDPSRLADDRQPEAETGAVCKVDRHRSRSISQIFGVCVLTLSNPIN